MIKEKRETMKVDEHSFISTLRYARVTEELVDWMLTEEKFTCMCWFDGTPEPQIPFVYEVSKG